jgi:hypothetical protein
VNTPNPLPVDALYRRCEPVGGINEKIEGFFDICEARGLTGSQGVLIPATNASHLMLKRKVVEAAAAGRFHIYTCRTVDEAIELLSGVSAGTRDEQGEYLPDSVNGRVAARLEEFSLLRQHYPQTGVTVKTVRKADKKQPPPSKPGPTTTSSPPYVASCWRHTRAASQTNP